MKPKPNPKTARLIVYMVVPFLVFLLIWRAITPSRYDVKPDGVQQTIQNVNTITDPTTQDSLQAIIDAQEQSIAGLTERTKRSEKRYAETHAENVRLVERIKKQPPDTAVVVFMAMTGGGIVTVSKNDGDTVANVPIENIQRATELIAERDTAIRFGEHMQTTAMRNDSIANALMIVSANKTAQNDNLTAQVTTLSAYTVDQSVKAQKSEAKLEKKVRFWKFATGAVGVVGVVLTFFAIL